MGDATKEMDGSVYLEEDTSKRMAAVAKHGDRAMELIGDERVVLTEEDVRIPPIPSQSPSFPPFLGYLGSSILPTDLFPSVHLKFVSLSLSPCRLRSLTRARNRTSASSGGPTV